MSRSDDTLSRIEDLRSDLHELSLDIQFNRVLDDAAIRKALRTIAAARKELQRAIDLDTVLEAYEHFADAMPGSVTDHFDGRERDAYKRLRDE